MALVNRICYIKYNIAKKKKKNTVLRLRDKICHLVLHDRTQKAEYFFHYLLKNKKK